MLQRRLGDSARPAPPVDFREATSSSAHFRRAAIDLEEGPLAAYIGQGANLTREARRDGGTLVSVEARQVAWLRSWPAPPCSARRRPRAQPSDVLSPPAQSGARVVTG